MCLDVNDLRKLVEEKDDLEEIIRVIRQKGLDSTLADRFGELEGNSRKGATINVEDIIRILKIGMENRDKNYISRDRLESSFIRGRI